jgi:hypothetical protein
MRVHSAEAPTVMHSMHEAFLASLQMPLPLRIPMKSKQAQALLFSGLTLSNSRRRLSRLVCSCVSSVGSSSPQTCRNDADVERSALYTAHHAAPRSTKVLKFRFLFLNFRCLGVGVGF